MPGMVCLHAFWDPRPPPPSPTTSDLLTLHDLSHDLPGLGTALVVLQALLTEILSQVVLTPLQQRGRPATMGEWAK